MKFEELKEPKKPEIDLYNIWKEGLNFAPYSKSFFMYY